MRVLGIGAHPDDIELGCFGTLSKHKARGDVIHEIVLTDSGLSGNTKVRMAEARKAARIISAKVYFGGFSEGNLRDTHEVVNYIEDLINDVRADIMYIHVAADRHQDHRYASLASTSAARSVEQVYGYETPSALGFSPTKYVDVTRYMGKKIEALNCHASQCKLANLDQGAMLGLARYRAHQAGLPGKMAEAFEVIRIVS